MTRPADGVDGVIGPDHDTSCAVSVIVPCTRPHLIEGIATALGDQAGDIACELIVAGDVEGLDAERWSVPTRLITVPDLHSNGRRCAGIDQARAPIIAFIDDDALPGEGWLATAASMPTTSREIWTGPEAPTRDSAAARLAYAVSSSLLAEGTLAHVDRRHRVVRWSDAPFCNLVISRLRLDEIGHPSTDIVWDLDDFEFCRRAHNAGTVFRNDPRLRIQHDRYPDHIRWWLAGKAADRRRTGQKIVSNPEFYVCQPGAAIAALVPPAMIAGAAWSRRSNRRQPAIGAALLAYVAAVITAAQRASSEDRKVRAAAFAASLVSLHLSSVVSLQAGILEGVVARLRRFR